MPNEYLVLEWLIYKAKDKKASPFWKGKGLLHYAIYGLRSLGLKLIKRMAKCGFMLWMPMSN